MVADKLTVILIGSDHKDLITRLLALHGKRTDHIVSLVARNLKHRDTHSPQQSAQIRHRGDDILGSLGAVSLIFGE